MNAANLIHDATIVGVFMLALYVIAQGLKVFRAGTLAEKARRAEKMRREFDRSKMQPRYTRERPAPRGR
jgi:hypothetical protein